MTIKSVGEAAQEWLADLKVRSSKQDTRSNQTDPQVLLRAAQQLSRLLTTAQLLNSRFAEIADGLDVRSEIAMKSDDPVCRLEDAITKACREAEVAVRNAQ